ncbi:MAG: hypothetical protein ACRD3I_08725 [Terriglobales bacterium]
MAKTEVAVTIETAQERLGISRPTLYTHLAILGIQAQYAKIGNRPRRVIPESVLAKIAARLQTAKV